MNHAKQVKKRRRKKKKKKKKKKVSGLKENPRKKRRMGCSPSKASAPDTDAHFQNVGLSENSIGGDSASAIHTAQLVNTRSEKGPHLGSNGGTTKRNGNNFEDSNSNSTSARPPKVEIPREPETVHIAPLRERAASSSPVAVETRTGLTFDRSASLGPSEAQNQKAKKRQQYPTEGLKVAVKQSRHRVAEEDDDLVIQTGPNKGGSRTGTSSNVFESMSEEQIKQRKLKEFTKVCSQITDHLYVSGEEVCRDYATLKKHNIGLIINSCQDVCENVFESSNIETVHDSVGSIHRNLEHQVSNKHDAKKIVYITLSLRDTMQEEISSFFFTAIQAIEAAAKVDVNVLVHCHQGVSRSGTLAIAYLMWAKPLGWKQALDHARTKREVLSPNTGFLCQLMEWEVWMNLRWPERLNDFHTDSGTETTLYAGSEGVIRSSPTMESGHKDETTKAEEGRKENHAVSPAHLWEEKGRREEFRNHFLSGGSIYEFEEQPCIAPTPSLFAVSPIRRPFIVSIPDYEGNARNGYEVLNNLQEHLLRTSLDETSHSHKRFEIGYVLQQCRSEKDRHRILPGEEKLDSAGVYVVVLPYSLTSTTELSAGYQDTSGHPVLESHPVIWIGKNVDPDCREGMVACARAEVRKWRLFMRSTSVDERDAFRSSSFHSTNIADTTPAEVKEGSHLHELLVNLMKNVKAASPSRYLSSGERDPTREMRTAANQSIREADTSVHDASAVPSSLRLENMDVATDFQQQMLNASTQRAADSPPVMTRRVDNDDGVQENATESLDDSQPIKLFALTETAVDVLRSISESEDVNVEANFLEDFDKEDFEEGEVRLLCEGHTLEGDDRKLDIWVWIGYSDASEIGYDFESLEEILTIDIQGCAHLDTQTTSGQKRTIKLVELSLPGILGEFNVDGQEIKAQVRVEWANKESRAFEDVLERGLEQV